MRRGKAAPAQVWGQRALRTGPFNKRYWWSNSWTTSSVFPPFLLLPVHPVDHQLHSSPAGAVAEADTRRGGYAFAGAEGLERAAAGVKVQMRRGRAAPARV